VTDLVITIPRLTDDALIARIDVENILDASASTQITVRVA
jgi:hypothetical protein